MPTSNLHLQNQRKFAYYEYLMKTWKYIKKSIPLGLKFISTWSV